LRLRKQPKRRPIIRGAAYPKPILLMSRERLRPGKFTRKTPSGARARTKDSTAYTKVGLPELGDPRRGLIRRCGEREGRKLDGSFQAWAYRIVDGKIAGFWFLVEDRYEVDAFWS
jgi:hypothetical protein